MKKLFAAAFLLGLATLCATGAGAKVRSVAIQNEITGLKAERGVEVDYFVDTEPSKVTITGEAPYVDMVTVKIVKKTLTISLNLPSDMRGTDINKYVKVVAHGPALTSFDISSSAEVDLKTPMLLGDNPLTVSCSTSGEADFGHVSGTAAVSLAASASGAISFKSLTCRSMSAVASSSGDIEIDEVRADKVTVECTSSGKVECDGAVSALSVAASSSGTVECKKLKAATVTVNAGSSSSVELEGAAVDVSGTVTTSASVDIRKLRANTVNISTRAGGTLKR